MADFDFDDDPIFDEPLDRLDELVTQLLDDSLGEEEFSELEQTLLASSEARSKYVGLMQLHVNLLDHFRPAGTPSLPKSPVLGFLADSHSPTTGLPRDVES